MKIEVFEGHVEVVQGKDKNKECFAMLNFGKSGGYQDEKAATDAAKFLIHGPELLEQLQESIEKYGFPGGPWNEPSYPGKWIEKAEKTLKLFKDSVFLNRSKNRK